MPSAFLSLPARASVLAAALYALHPTTVSAQGDPATVQIGNDIPASWRTPESETDYVRREAMIPMRDGVRLKTYIVMRKGIRAEPMILERTPYDASSFLAGKAAKLRDVVTPGNRDWVEAGYILVLQDIRGKFGSEGAFVMTRPPRGALNPTKTDDTTDAYDTIDWLVGHVPESNGRVGMVGSSYDGWAVVMALLGPHPALRAAAPESPMIDGWMGDDWFHHGAFRQSNFDYYTHNTSVKGEGDAVIRTGPEDYQEFLDAGSAGDYATLHGLDTLAWWRRTMAHPAYDAFWQGQALDRLVAARPSAVPTVWLQGLWDQEDIYGAVHAWERLRERGAIGSNHLVLGPWSHSQVNRSGEALGPLTWGGDTAEQFRHEVLVPFFDANLKDPVQTTGVPPILAYDPTAKRWDRYDDWPVVQPSALTPMYLQPGGRLAPKAPEEGSDSYLSDPAKPVPFEPLPVHMGDRATWATWLVRDQRFVATRSDVLSYQGPTLDRDVKLAGAPIADLFARTTGSDADFVVKLIDVYPPTWPEQPEMAGYQLPISLDIFRGRYRKSFETAAPIRPGKVEEYRFQLPPVNYTMKAGHRIMVQIQSSLFPLYDRNPQTFVPNIFAARPEDYRRATMTIEYGRTAGSAVLLPIVAEKEITDMPADSSSNRMQEGIVR